jgi:hypothetical protein
MKEGSRRCRRLEVAEKSSCGGPKLAGAKEAAEKGLDLKARFERHPSGAEAHVDLSAFAARLKPCPFKAGARSEFFRSL